MNIYGSRFEMHITIFISSHNEFACGLQLTLTSDWSGWLICVYYFVFKKTKYLCFYYTLCLIINNLIDHIVLIKIILNKKRE